MSKIVNASLPMAKHQTVMLTNLGMAKPLKASIRSPTAECKRVNPKSKTPFRRQGGDSCSTPSQ